MKFIHICLFCIFTLFFQHKVFSQTDSINLSLIANQDFKNYSLEDKKIVNYGITSKKKNFIEKYNPVSLTFSGLMFFYQKLLSQQISADCLYSPTCSEYTRQLFIRYGILRGLIFSADRLMRCDRISATTIHQISIDKHDGKVHETVERYKH